MIQNTQILVPKGMEYPLQFVEDDLPREHVVFQLPWLEESELAAATKKFPVVCTDVALVDDEGHFVLAKRQHACAIGWWWKGGGKNANLTPEQNIARLLEREIGRVPESVTYLAQFYHVWTDTRERPGEAREDLIFLHVLHVTEEDIANIELDPNEYDVAAGLMRYDGTQKVRSVVQAMYHRYHEFLKNGRISG